MFVLHEFERILQRTADSSRRRKAPARITLPAIERVPVGQLRSLDRVRMQPPRDVHKEPPASGWHSWNDRNQDPANLSWASNGPENSSTDRLFMGSMKQILLDSLAQLPPRAYPSARLMICDHESHELLNKFQYLAAQSHARHARHQTSFILHRPPYGVLAVFLLDDLVDQIGRLGRPFVRLAPEAGGSGQQMARFDYSIIKEVFPYLKISDLVVVLHQVGELKLRMFTMDGRREHQVIQFLSHFARSALLLELRAIDKRIGQHHLLFDNVTAFLPHNNQLFFDSMNALEKQAAELDNLEQKFNYHLMPPLTHLTLIAYRLIRLVQQLGWSLESITFRLGDPNGFTKVFARILDSILRSEAGGGGGGAGGATEEPASHHRRSPTIVPVRVLVLDRYFDFQGLLRHADRYGAFAEQELKSSLANMATTRRIHALDQLDARLCFERLDEVLGTLLKLSARAGPSKAAPAAGAICDQRAIQKHLMIVRQMYKMMSEGYLLLRKLELSVESISTKLRALATALTERDQSELVSRLQRIASAFKQLLALKSGAVKVSDALRFACMLIDLLNMFLYLCTNEPTRKQLASLKGSLVGGKEFLDQLRALIEKRGNDLTNVAAHINQKGAHVDLFERLDEFDKISAKYCSYRSVLSLEEIVAQFYNRQLDSVNYPTQKLAASPPLAGLVRGHARNKIIVLTLGSMSYDELHRVKLLEAQLTRAKYAHSKPRPAGGKSASPTNATNWPPGNETPRDILLIACGFIRPDEFIGSL